MKFCWPSQENNMEFRQCHMPHMLYIDEELNKPQKKAEKTNQKMATNQQLSSKAKHPRQNMTLCRASGGNAAEVVSQRITSASNSEPKLPTHSLRPGWRSGVLKRCPQLATSSWPAYIRMFDSVLYLKIYPKASNQTTSNQSKKWGAPLQCEGNSLGPYRVEALKKEFLWWWTSMLGSLTIQKAGCLGFATLTTYQIETSCVGHLKESKQNTITAK